MKLYDMQYDSVLTKHLCLTGGNLASVFFQFFFLNGMNMSRKEIEEEHVAYQLFGYMRFNAFFDDGCDVW